MGGERTLVEKYIKDHKKVKIKTTGIPRFWLKAQGRRDAKKKIFQAKDMETGGYFEKEKEGIFQQIVEKEKLYLEKCLFEIRKESTVLIAEYKKNLQELVEIAEEQNGLENSQNGIALRRKGNLFARECELMEQNLKKLVRIYEIDEMVTTIENCSEDWILQHAERMNEKRMIYYMGVRKVLPEIELPKDMQYQRKQTIHASDACRKQFLQKLEAV